MCMLLGPDHAGYTLTTQDNVEHAPVAGQSTRRVSGQNSRRVARKAATGPPRVLTEAQGPPQPPNNSDNGYGGDWESGGAPVTQVPCSCMRHHPRRWRRLQADTQLVVPLFLPRRCCLCIPPTHSHPDHVAATLFLFLSRGHVLVHCRKGTVHVRKLSVHALQAKAAVARLACC